MYCILFIFLWIKGLFCKHACSATSTRLIFLSRSAFVMDEICALAVTHWKMQGLPDWGVTCHSKTCLHLSGWTLPLLQMVKTHSKYLLFIRILRVNSNIWVFERSHLRGVPVWNLYVTGILSPSWRWLIISFYGKHTQHGLCHGCNVWTFLWCW